MNIPVDANGGDLIHQVERVRELLSAVATGSSTHVKDEAAYKEFRKKLMTNAVVAPLLPHFLERCRTLGDFWTFIKPRTKTYQERREFLLEQFDPLLTYLEGQGASLSAEPILAKLDSDHVRTALQKVVVRVARDPEGAMTASRALVETVCKHILDDAGIKYDDKAELPKLYRQVAERLNLAPDQHTEGVFKQVLGGCMAVVEGLGSLRSRLGDAHGKGRKAARPAARHATLVVNLASAMCVFLVETWAARTPHSKVTPA